MSTVSPERPIVAVTTRVVRMGPHGEVRDAISHDLVRWLDELGFVPVPVPNALALPDEFLAAIGARALVLSGGDDPLPATTGDVAGIVAENAAPDRYRTERALIAAAIGHGVPILGICRGFQMLNAFFGGRIRRLPETGAHVRTMHPVRLDGAYASLAGHGEATVNSFHEWGIALDDVALDLVPMATAHDGTIEACHHARLPAAGIMWHPERPGSTGSFDAALVRTLIRAPDRWLGMIRDTGGTS